MCRIGRLSHKERQGTRDRGPSPPRKGLKVTRCTLFTYWWAHRDSNPGPTGYEPAALPLSYGPEGRVILPYEGQCVNRPFLRGVQFQLRGRSRMGRVLHERSCGQVARTDLSSELRTGAAWRFLQHVPSSLDTSTSVTRL